MKAFYLPLSKFQDLGVPNPGGILFSSCCKALYPLVNKCSISTSGGRKCGCKEREAHCWETELWLKDALKIKGKERRDSSYFWNRNEEMGEADGWLAASHGGLFQLILGWGSKSLPRKIT